MPTVDAIRYWAALLILVTIPPALLFWYAIHPFAALWRRLGRPLAYTVVLTPCLAVGYALWRWREPLLRVEYGFVPWLAALGAVLYLIAAYLEIQCRKHLKLHILVGAPELARDGAGRLLTEGIYGRIRHPRYLSFALGVPGMALFVNYLTIYLLTAACVPVFWGLIALEERELRQRFGAAYEDYARRVPRWIPRHRPSSPRTAPAMPDPDADATAPGRHRLGPR